MSHVSYLIIESSASILAIVGVLWRVSRKIISGIEGVKTFASHSTEQLDRIANSLDRFVDELESLKIRVSDLERK